MKLLFISCCFAFAFQVFPQSKGLILLTGATFEELGLSFSDISFDIGNEYWISNKLPLGNNLRITVKEPKGFFIENGYCQPGVSILVKRENGDTLGYAPNIFNPTDQIEASMLTKLVLSFALKDSVRPGDKCLMESVFYDAKGTNKLILNLAFSLSAENDSLQTDNFIYSISHFSGYQVNSTIPVKSATSRDTLISKELYQEMLLEGVELAEKDIRQLQEQFYFYNADFQAGSYLSLNTEDAVTFSYNKKTKLYDIRVRLPKNPSTGKLFYWRLRLENEAEKQVIEILNAF